MLSIKETKIWYDIDVYYVLVMLLLDFFEFLSPLVSLLIILMM